MRPSTKLTTQPKRYSRVMLSALILLSGWLILRAGFNRRMLWPMTRSLNATLQVTDDIVGLRSVFVNIYFVAKPDGSWVLIDAGIPISGPGIREMATRLFGTRRPDCILLTHGHFDHVGVLETLAEEWDVPVYAHALEMPFLTGKASYPPPDPWVGGFMAISSPLYPRSPVNLGHRAKVLPDDHSVPHLEGWRWIHTPGHTPGHVSFFRDRDRLLIAGDAIVTVKQESALSVLAQAQHMWGPPQYFTPNWEQAEESVKRLAALDANIAATGHGTPMKGERMRAELKELAAHFREEAVPEGGRYVGSPVQADETGPKNIPPPRPIPRAIFITGGGTVLLVLTAVVALKRMI